MKQIKCTCGSKLETKNSKKFMNKLLTEGVVKDVALTFAIKVSRTFKIKIFNLQSESCKNQNHVTIYLEK